MTEPNDIQAALDTLYEKGWTLVALGEVLGVSRYTVARWMAGTTQPVPAVPILFALRAMDRLPVPAWPKPRTQRLSALTVRPVRAP